jgi:hypothetical protein
MFQGCPLVLIDALRFGGREYFDSLGDWLARKYDRRIVEAHDGNMAAENNPDGGATVWFSVPAAAHGSP